jgi:pimeloyl-ACP methyl ester carboxylesterase
MSPSRLLEGCPLHYSVRGSGTPILFIQGTGVHGSGWGPQVDEFQREHRCITFDNRGLGLSRPRGAGLSIERMARDGLAVLEAAGAKQAHVVGHSLGGLVALQLALLEPARTQSLALLCTFADGQAPARGAGIFWTGVRSRLGTARMRRHAFLELILPPEKLRGLDRDALAAELAPLFGHDLAEQSPIVLAQIAAMRACDLRARLAELASVPTLVVSTALDRIAPPALGRALAFGIPGARYVEIAEAAHGVPITHAARVNALLREHFQAASMSAAAPLAPTGGRS